MIHVVGACIWKEDRILLARRSSGKLTGHWEFPGGKVETGESFETGLIREIREELAIDIRVNEKIGDNYFSIEHKDYCLHIYQADYVAGAIELVDHDAVEWVKPEQLLDYRLTPPDVPIAKKVCVETRKTSL